MYKKIVYKSIINKKIKFCNNILKKNKIFNIYYF